MQFHVRKRRQTPSVIIVALIDVLIVLLIFLMVTTTFKQQPALKLALPESSQAKRSGANEEAPFVVSIDEKGNIRAGPDATPLTVDQLKGTLVSRTQEKPELKVALSADKAAPVGQVVRVMDATKAAGIKAVNLFVKEIAQ